MRAVATPARWVARLALSATLLVPVGAAADPALGAPGTPIQLNVGYMPYYSGAWSGVVMRGKRFYEKYLPAGSTVEFSSAIDGVKIGAALRAGRQHVGYLDDAAALEPGAPAAASAVRLVASLGLSHDQCSVLLVRADAPRFASESAALQWLNSRTLAAPPHSCMESFARVLLRRNGLTAGLVAEQNIEVITAGFRAGRLDAAVVSEPSASRLVGEGSARRVASGASLRHLDAGLLAMRADLIAQRPDVVRAWLRAELEAQQFLADPAHAQEILRMVASQTAGFTPHDLWQGLYGQHAALEGGSSLRLWLPFTLGTPVPAAASPELARRIADEFEPRPRRREIHALAPPPHWAAQQALPRRPTILVDAQGWTGIDARWIATVLDAVAAELVARFPGRPLAPIRVKRSAQAPVALYERGPAGEIRIELTAGGNDAGAYVYEFAHELCHVLANHERHPHHAVTRRHQWFEEALCEVASLYTLKALARAWQHAAPSASLAAAAPQLEQTAARLQQETHRRLPTGSTLASWYRASSDALGRGAYQRERNEVVANLLLPLFEENPELWEAIGFLNLDAPGEDFQQYLQTWLDNAPPRYKDVIRYTMTMFFARDTAGSSGGPAPFPLRPLELIVTFGPGGGADGMARTLAALLEPRLGVPVIVRNVPGAAGNAGLTKLLLSPDPDHTLATLVALTAAAWAGGVGNVGAADFRILGVVQDSPSMLFVAADSPIADFRAFLDQARARPGHLRVATSGHGTLDDVTLALLAAAGHRSINVPFAKPEERYAAALARRTDALFEEPGDVAEHLASGRLRPLVVFADARHAAFPAVPAIREFGLAIGDLPNFRGLAMSTRASPDKARVLVDALAQALASPDWRRYCAETYTCTAIDTPAQAQARVQGLVDKVAATLERMPR
ncbi:MAG TPA: tripartite tricarboxylate transporter substrate-binding protein [Burkholderiaceae bacterium]|nr:tripartite tricarboxylate transporter substrate-binding protein [Burkholderiaceae bacterium]